MLVSKDDFAIKSSNFDLSNGDNIIRIICGLFMFPHVASKFVGGALNEKTVGFFAKAGFVPPEAFVYLAAGVETLAGIMLVLAICTRWGALMAAGALAVAAFALFQVGGFKWVWNLGGFEYPVFWAITCMAVAVKEFKRVSAVPSPGYTAAQMRTA